MIRMLAAIMTVALLCGCATRHDAITFHGVGLVKVGATVQEASKAVGTPLQAAPDRGGDEKCHFVWMKAHPTLLFMVEDGRITRTETDDPAYQTAGGVRVGDSEAQVTGVYGAGLEVQGHKYDPEGHNFIVRSADRRFALVMETDGKKVVYIRAGQVPSAEYVEGCL